jgi:hypothetical protein
MMTIAKSRTYGVVDAPEHRIASTGVAFQGRTASTDRRFTAVDARPAPTGLGNPTGVLVGATTVPRGTSMI